MKKRDFVPVKYIILVTQMEVLYHHSSKSVMFSSKKKECRDSRGLFVKIQEGSKREERVELQDED